MKRKIITFTEEELRMLEELSTRYQLRPDELIKMLLKREYEKLYEFYLEE